MFRGLLKRSSSYFVFINQRKNCQCKRKVSTKASQIMELQNGLRIATEETTSPLACASLFILTGSRFENECNNGMTHFIEHMAYKGFKSMDKNTLESKLGTIGAKMTAHTTREYQCFSGVSLAENTQEIITILSKIVTDLQLSSDEIEKEKAIICSELIDIDKDPKKVVFNYLHETAFQGTPLAQTIMPSYENLSSFNCDVAFQFLCKNYTLPRLVLAVSGGISHCNVTNHVEQCFNYFVDSECPPYAPQRYTGSQIIYRDDSMPFLHVAIAVEVPGFNSADYLPLLVASCLTDTWDRSQEGNMRHGSLLARAAATSSLCERFESFYTAYSDIGLWGVYFVGKMQESDEMLSNIQDCWMQMCSTIRKNDLERAVNIAKHKLARNVNGVVNSCHDLGRQVLLSSQRKSLNALYEELNSLSVGTIKNLGDKFIYDKCPVVAAVGPSEVLPDYTRIRAGMYWLRL